MLLFCHKSRANEVKREWLFLFELFVFRQNSTLSLSSQAMEKNLENHLGIKDGSWTVDIASVLFLRLFLPIPSSLTCYFSLRLPLRALMRDLRVSRSIKKNKPSSSPCVCAQVNNVLFHFLRSQVKSNCTAHPFVSSWHRYCRYLGGLESERCLTLSENYDHEMVSNITVQLPRLELLFR